MQLHRRLEPINPIIMEDRRLLFRNFSGEEGKFNAKGDRNFNVVLEPEEAARLENDGWNVKWLKARDPEEEPLARLEVTVAFGKIPPRIVLITSKGKTQLPEDLVGLLDWAELANVDLIIRPYQWDVNGRTGVKAYLKSIYATIREDELELKYRDVPDSAQASLPYDGDTQPAMIQAKSETVAITRGGDYPPDHSEADTPF